MVSYRQVLCLCFAIALTGCFGRGGAPDDPAIVGLAEAQASDTLEGSAGDPPDLLDDASPDADAAAPRRRGRGLFGLFGGGGGRAGGDTPPEVAPGTRLPFAQIASVCGVSPRKLGTEVDEAPRTGRARFALIDPTPGTTAARTQYLTGFSDRCARQFTGALVLFGSTDVHEATRYAQGNRRPYSETDEAYEQMKSRICGVRRNVPCPADRRAKLDREVVFVTIYPQFGSGGEWFELLLADGEVRAQAMNGT